MPKGKKDNKSFIRASIVQNSVDQESRTFDVTFATPTPVLRYSWFREEYYNEVLDMNGADLSLAGERGLPFLDNHSSWGSVRDNTLGRARNIRREGDTYVATITLSSRSNLDDLWDDIRNGIVADISFGYSVDKLERMDKKEGEQYRTYMVRKWTAKEISLVNIPADPRAGVRSEDGSEDMDLVALYAEQNRQNQNNVNSNPEYIMKREQIIAMLAKRGITVDANISDEALNAELERALNPEGPDPKAVQTAIEAERKRSSDITAAVRSAKLSTEFAEKLISEGKSIDEARAAIIEEFAKQDPNAGTRSTVVVGEDREATMRRSATEAALVMRESPELVRGDKSPYDKDVITEAHKMRGETLLDLAKASLIRGGHDIEGLNKVEIVGRAFTSSTSDFPVLLEGANRTVLLASYEAQADTWRRFCATGSVSDFREHKRLRMGTFSDLERLNENGEYKNKKITDADYEKVSIDTKGNMINVSRKMIINDDLGGFLKLAGMLGRAAARSIENDVFATLKLNGGMGPKLVDGKTLFHADHGNIATAAGAPTVDIIDKMRQQMAQFQDKDKNDFLDIRPALALAPLALGSTLRLLNQAQYEPTAQMFEKPNIVAGLFRDVIDTPRLTGNPWYVFADPSEEPVLEVNFLNGVQTPYMESEEGFTVDGIRWKIRMDYGIGAVGFRGAIRNAGA